MKKVLILLFSSCWVIPLLAAFYLHIAFIKNEIYPIIYGGKSQLNSFPFLQSVEILLNISLVWFISVIILWSIYFIQKNDYNN